MSIQVAEAKYGIRRIGFMPLLQVVEAKYGIIFKMFFSLNSPIFGPPPKINMLNLNFYG